MNQNFKYLLFFIITFVTTTFSGVEWTTGHSALELTPLLESEFWITGMSFSIPFLLILTCHEFGHYFTAKYYKAAVTLPFYIPMWFFGLGPSIGTMGAFIKIKSPLHTTKEFYDVGIAGPLAGFVVALGVITYGFITLPPAEHIYSIHPEYQQFGLDYAKYAYQNKEGLFYLGDNLLFMIFRELFSYKAHLIPNNFELMHYPLLFSGYLACFFTALNLIPIGQLDGGHVLYGLLGWKKSNKVFPYIFKAFILYGGLGFIKPWDSTDDLLMYVPIYLLILNFSLEKLYPKIKTRAMWGVGIFLFQLVLLAVFPKFEGYQGFMIFGLIIGRFLGVFHPPSLIENDIGLKRKILGWIAILVFILCFSPKPFIYL